MRKLLAAAVTLSASVLLLTQVPSFAQEVVRSVQPDDLQPSIQRFLAQKSSVQSLREARINERGKAADAREVNQMLNALGLSAPRPSDSVSDAQADALQNSLLAEAVQLLVFSDMSPGRIRQLQVVGINPLDVAIRYLQGHGTLTDQALLADRTVIGEIVSVKMENLGDGFGSTVVFRVTDSLVGADTPTLALRQRSGLKEGGDTITFSTDISQSDVGNSFLLTASEGLYDEGSAVRKARPAQNGGGASRLHVQLGTRYLITGDSALPVYSAGQPLLVTDVVQQLATLKQAKGRLSAPARQ